MNVEYASDETERRAYIINGDVPVIVRQTHGLSPHVKVPAGDMSLDQSIDLLDSLAKAVDIAREWRG